MTRIIVTVGIILFLWGCAASPRYTVDQMPDRETSKAPSSSPSTPSSGETPGETIGEPSGTPKTPSKSAARTPKPGIKIKGLASYYADDFHGKKTANGEIFNMHGLTAAHKTWALNTWVEVKNLANGRTVIVRINDRGPYVGNRIIDMSLGAAKELDMINAGVQEVEIEILTVGNGK